MAYKEIIPGHLLNVKDNTVTGVFASRNHPVSRGRLCVRGWHMHELLRTEERITSPAIRKNGKLEPVTMDEAVSYIVDSIKEKVTDPDADVADEAALVADVLAFVSLVAALDALVAALVSLVAALVSLVDAALADAAAFVA